MPECGKNEGSMLLMRVGALSCAVAVAVLMALPAGSYAQDQEAIEGTETLVVVAEESADDEEAAPAEERAEVEPDGTLDSAENPPEALDGGDGIPEANASETEESPEASVEETPQAAPDSNTTASDDVPADASETAVEMPVAANASAVSTHAAADRKASAPMQQTAAKAKPAKTEIAKPKKAAAKRVAKEKFNLKARVKGEGSAETVRSLTVKGTKYLLLPSYAKLRSLLVCAQPGSASILVLGKKSGGYQKASFKDSVDLSTFAKDKAGFRTMYVKGSKGDKPFVVKVMKSAKIRTLYIHSLDPKNKGRAYIEKSRSHKAKAKGSIVLVMPDGSLTYSGKLDNIKGRGNSTWKQAKKKPYQIKLDEKASLIDGEEGNAAKTWVLLANAFDDTLARNYIAYKLAKAIGMENAPECEFVDLYYDGEFRGNYLLSEKVQVNKGRVEVVEQENESTDGKDLEKHATGKAKNKYGKEFKYVKGVKTPKDITGGYLVELDSAYYHGERSWFNTSIGHFVLKSPEDASKAQVKYISERVQAAINELKSGKAPKTVDLESLAHAHLVNEVAKSPDYIRYSSTYFHKDAGSKTLYAGPVWDFDAAFGSHDNQNGVNYRKATGFATAGHANFYTKNKSFEKVMKKVFKKKVLPEVNAFVGGGNAKGMPTMKQLKAQLKASATLECVWHPKENANFNHQYFSSWGKSMDYTASWLKQRITWMKKAILK